MSTHLVEPPAQLGNQSIDVRIGLGVLGHRFACRLGKRKYPVQLDRLDVPRAKIIARAADAAAFDGAENGAAVESSREGSLNDGQIAEKYGLSLEAF